jgi:hypothetical protein
MTSPKIQRKLLVTVPHGWVAPLGPGSITCNVTLLLKLGKTIVKNEGKVKICALEKLSIPLL